MTEAESLRAKTKVKEEEQFQINQDPNRLKLHLMAPVGWLNDPNGLCQFRGIYHVFYQYSPLDPNGSMKAWGHYTSKDLLEWKQMEISLYPDMAFDKDGVYSGSAYVKQDEMYLFYTGNVKQEGTHDFCYSGREANTILVTSKDGEQFSEKELLMSNKDYPQDYSCHIRDPKVWKKGDIYYMIQGGRKKKCKGTEDIGTALIFRSKDLRNWTFWKDITTEQRFGYMWECPDYFNLKGNGILSISPQGVPAEKYRFQNVYQSGYFVIEQDFVEQEDEKKFVPDKDKFHEWDMGFDFYAPQTFQDEKGRRILIGWAGICDAEYDNEPTVKKGWQHALTIPRELSFSQGRILQNPVDEYKRLRSLPIQVETSVTAKNPVLELEINDILAEFQIVVRTGTSAFTMSYKDNILNFNITEDAGHGRNNRKMRLDKLEKLRMILDTSLVEFYVNDGEAVFTSRFYFPDNKREIVIKGAKKNILYYLDALKISR